MKHWHAYGRIVRRAIRSRLKDWKVLGDTALPEPAVYIVHHQNLFGPVHAAALMPTDVRPWVLYPFCSRRDCFNQYYGYTFTKRFGWPSGLAAPAAALSSLVIPPLMHAIGAVPVYRNGRNILRTMNTSVDALTLGHSLLICPDREYADTSSRTGDLYSGFLNLERAYYRKTRHHLPFIPLYLSPSKKQLLFCKALYFEGKTSFKSERAQLAVRLSQSLNDAAQACGDL